MRRLLPLLLASTAVIATVVVLTTRARGPGRLVAAAETANRNKRDASLHTAAGHDQRLGGGALAPTEAPTRADPVHRDAAVHVMPQPSPVSEAPDRAEPIVVSVIPESRITPRSSVAAIAPQRFTESLPSQRVVVDVPIASSAPVSERTTRVIDADLAPSVVRIDSRAHTIAVLHTIDGDSVPVTTQELLRLRVLPRSSGAIRVP